MSRTPLSIQAAEATQNGFAIRALREKDGRSVQWLADMVDVTAPHIRNIENEHRNASATHLNLIAKALDVPVAAIKRTASAEMAPAVGQ